MWPPFFSCRTVHKRTPAPAAGSAADALAAAAAHVLRCTQRHGNLAAAWKLLGDTLLLHHAVDPAGALLHYALLHYAGLHKRDSRSKKAAAPVLVARECDSGLAVPSQLAPLLCVCSPASSHTHFPGI